MESLMVRLRSYVLSIVVLTYFAAGASLAQGQTQPQSAPKPAETSTMKMEDVSKWTQKQWNAAKAKWSEEKIKWPVRKRIHDSLNTIAGPSRQSVLPDDVANADCNADSGNDDVHSAPQPLLASI